MCQKKIEATYLTRLSVTFQIDTEKIYTYINRVQKELGDDCFSKYIKSKKDIIHSFLTWVTIQIIFTMICQPKQIRENLDVFIEVFSTINDWYSDGEKTNVLKILDIEESLFRDTLGFHGLNIKDIQCQEVK